MNGKSLRTPLVVATLAAAAALASGCSSSGQPIAGTTATSPAQNTAAGSSSSAGTDSTTDTGGTSATGGTGGSSASVEDGSALKSKLTSVAAPAGFSMDASSLMGSDNPPSSPDTSSLTLQGCSDLTNASSDTLTLDYRGSYYNGTLNNASSGAQVDVTYADYYPGDASKQIAEISQLVGKCSSYQSQDQNGKSVTLNATMSTPGGLGDQALDIHLQATESGYISDEFLLVRKGDHIFAIDQSDAAGNSLASLTSLAGPYVAALS